MTVSTRSPTLHDQILRDLKGRILDGDWEPGFQLPIETELAIRFGVSRMTMNKVLAQLTREGFLVRRKKRGTFVAQPRAQSAVLEISDIEAEVTALGRPYRYELLDRAVRPWQPDDEVGAHEDRIEEGEELLFLRGLHFAGPTPFCLETRVVNPAMAEGALEQDFSNVPPGTWLLRSVPWGRAAHRIRAIHAGARDASALNIARHSASLEIVRRTEMAGNWVTWARLVYPGDSHQIMAEFESDASGGAGS